MWGFLKKLITDPPHDPAILLVVTHLKELKIGTQSPHINVHSSTSYNCQKVATAQILADEQINKMRPGHTMESCSSIEQNEVRIHGQHLENIMLCQKARHKGSHTVWFCLCETPKTGKPMKTRQGLQGLCTITRTQAPPEKMKVFWSQLHSSVNY